MGSFSYFRRYILADAIASHDELFLLFDLSSLATRKHTIRRTAMSEFTMKYEQKNMPFRRLGSSGLRVPVFSIGGCKCNYARCQEEPQTYKHLTRVDHWRYREWRPRQGVFSILRYRLYSPPSFFSPSRILSRRLSRMGLICSTKRKAMRLAIRRRSCKVSFLFAAIPPVFSGSFSSLEAVELSKS